MNVGVLELETFVLYEDYLKRFDEDNDNKIFFSIIAENGFRKTLTKTPKLVKRKRLIS